MISAPAATGIMDMSRKRNLLPCRESDQDTAVSVPLLWSLYRLSCPDVLHACDSGQGKTFLKNRVNLTCCVGLDSFGCGWPFVRGN
jgi:hypothetical protein